MINKTDHQLDTVGKRYIACSKRESNHGGRHERNGCRFRWPKRIDDIMIKYVIWHVLWEQLCSNRMYSQTFAHQSPFIERQYHNCPLSRIPSTFQRIGPASIRHRGDTRIHGRVSKRHNQIRAADNHQRGTRFHGLPIIPSPPTPLLQRRGE